MIISWQGRRALLNRSTALSARRRLCWWWFVQTYRPILKWDIEGVIVEPTATWALTQPATTPKAWAESACMPCRSTAARMSCAKSPALPGKQLTVSTAGKKIVQQARQSAGLLPFFAACQRQSIRRAFNRQYVSSGNHGSGQHSAAVDGRRRARRGHFITEPVTRECRRQRLQLIPTGCATESQHAHLGLQGRQHERANPQQHAGRDVPVSNRSFPCELQQIKAGDAAGILHGQASG